MTLSKETWNRMKKKLGVEKAPAVELDQDKPVTLAGENEVAFTGKLLKTEDGTYPSVECWPEKRMKTHPQLGPSFPLAARQDGVAVIQLQPRKPGMVRLLFIEVETEPR
ncbi:hypothetical protein [Luteolibacter soli]|uniref:Uncharacterized protein n=1 Tax=Luteolibacter soli TaxID=3135280 RepID=A0ABU9APT9_9BACT